MTQQPITPPPGLVDKWNREFYGTSGTRTTPNELHIAKRAAQWGADQELEACVGWMRSHPVPDLSDRAINLHTVRRPESQSLLKQRALKGLDVMITNGHLDADLAAALREVLEASDG